MLKNDNLTQMKRTALAVALAFLPLAAQAAGLGKITVHSALGQPLRAELEVTANRDETPSLVAKVANADAFRLAGIEYAPALATLRFSREIKERGGRRFIELTSDRPLNEPFIDMLVELSWSSGRLVREYTFLLDPPELASKVPPAPIVAPEVKAEVRPEIRQIVVPPAPAAATVPSTIPAEKPAATAPVDARQPVAKPPAETAAVKPSEGIPESTVLKSSNKLAGLAKEEAGRTVVEGDTLGKIAGEIRLDGVSFDQMVVALFRQNQDAFDGDNMNRLRAGKILNIPDAETARQVPESEARKEVLAQAADFNSYRRKLAEAASVAPARDQSANQLATGKIAPKVEDKAPPVASGKDKLEVSRSESTKDTKDARDANGKLLQGRVAAMEEDIVARGKALKDASSRIAELEQNIQAMKKLAEIKSQAGAEIQKQAQPQKSVDPVASAPAVAPVTPPATAPANAVVPVAPAAEAPKAADAPKAVEAPKPVAKKAVVAPPPEPEPEPTFMEENGPMVLGGGGLLALLLGGLGFAAYRRKRKESDAHEEPVAASDVAPSSVFSSGPADAVASEEASQFSATGALSATSAEAMDPVTEADTFLAFGRDAQAEEILLDALKLTPNRQAIHLKLLDIYFGRRNQSQFAAIAGEFHAVVSGSGSDWDKVATMGRELDPGNSLYGPVAGEAVKAAPAKADIDLGATMILEAPVPQAPPALPVAEAPTVEAVPSIEPESADLETSVLDFDLDLGTSDEQAAPTSAKSDASSEVAALDIDFDMPSPAKVAAPLDMMLETGKFEAPKSPPAAAEPMAEPESKVTASSSAIDFEFELTAPETKSAPEPEAMLDLPAVEMPKSPSAAPLDFGSISLELDSLPEPAPEGDKADPAANAAPPAADNPEVTTKLELATAYEEMGDRDGARELYEEALKEGSPAQQDLARAKLASLG